MPSSNDILLTLNMEGAFIRFDDDCLSEEKIGSITYLVYTGTQTDMIPDVCPRCGCIHHDGNIIKYGTKAAMIKIPPISNRPALLKFKKQRFLCKECGKTFTVDSTVVKRNCSISQNTLHAIHLKSKEKKSQKDIAKELGVSHGTVNALSMKVYSEHVVMKNFLPKHLCFDEFKSVKKSSGKMSFLFLNAETGAIIDILEDRQYSALERYFNTFTTEARAAVETVCMDMYVPYKQLVKALFPNAKIIIDRFHIIQLISRSLNQTRTSVMKNDKTNYNKLKRYWKLLLKNEEKLNDTEYKKYVCFKKLMREKDIVDYLLSTSQELKETYELYQDLLSAFRRKDADGFFKACKSASSEISGYMKTSIKTLCKNENEIRNALTEKWSNGIIEGTNNLIKVIKRIAFGYRSFVSFKTRILLITDTLIPTHQKGDGTISDAISQ